MTTPDKQPALPGGEHAVQLSQADAARLRAWLAQPSGSWSNTETAHLPAHPGGRLTIESVEDGGLLVRTKPHQRPGPPPEQCPESQRASGGHSWETIARYTRCLYCGEMCNMADGTAIHPLITPESERQGSPFPADYDPDAILANPLSHPAHVLIARINIGVRDRGEQWSKCPSCGMPYIKTEEWSDETVCSPGCHDAFAEHLGLV